VNFPALLALLQNCRISRRCRSLLCFAALPQAPFFCHRQRSLSSPKAGTLAKLSYISVFFLFVADTVSWAFLICRFLARRLYDQGVNAAFVSENILQ